LAERSADWMRTAELDLAHARHARDDGDYNWSAFASHQAAEKAVKAVYQKLHMEAWGHAVSELLAHLPQQAKPDGALVDRAKELDRHYIPTRYPNGFDIGAPADYYTFNVAEEAIGHAEAILRFCHDLLDR
jgi:HEPN domain-containing protein